MSYVGLNLLAQPQQVQFLLSNVQVWKISVSIGCSSFMNKSFLKIRKFRELTSLTWKSVSINWVASTKNYNQNFNPKTRISRTQCHRIQQWISNNPSKGLLLPPLKRKPRSIVPHSHIRTHITLSFPVRIGKVQEVKV